MCDFSRVSAWFCDEKISLKKVVSTFTSGGDMSIVGTRPPLISETNLYEPHHKANHNRIFHSHTCHKHVPLHRHGSGLYPGACSQTAGSHIETA